MRSSPLAHRATWRESCPARGVSSRLDVERSTRFRSVTRPKIAAVDLFCGAGGLSLGLQAAGISVVAGIDLDPNCQYPYETNIGAKFIQADVSEVTGDSLTQLWPAGHLRLLAGCAPCQPFSKHRRGEDTSSEPGWGLLDHFSRLVRETSPDFVTMENVSGVQHSEVFLRFVTELATNYDVDYEVVYAPNYGLAQHRKRLILVASRHGSVSTPRPLVSEHEYVSVRDVIAGLPSLEHGEQDPSDPLHRSRSLSEINLKRMRASVPGGTWRDWPEDLRAECHKRASGSSFQSVYARMSWDEPAPTITTQAYSFGSGRFGHPDQDRSITLREAAMLQGFPREYKWTKPGESVRLAPIGRLVGNAVPPPLGKAIGATFAQHAATLEVEA
ncbi:putative BsuMI modification methylase subunit YdiO [Microbacterium foliorum]|nr:putative BsuMI modification methylase subunit YdiO [Microbacterium foliorum]